MLQRVGKGLHIDPAAQSLQLTFSSDLLSTNSSNLQREFLALLETVSVKSGGWSTLIFDLSAAKIVDSVGLNLIVGLYKEAKKRGAKTRALVKSPNIRRTFAFARLDSPHLGRTGRLGRFAPAPRSSPASATIARFLSRLGRSRRILAQPL